jgi:hypothetical protein
MKNEFRDEQTIEPQYFKGGNKVEKPSTRKINENKTPPSPPPKKILKEGAECGTTTRNRYRLVEYKNNFTNITSYIIEKRKRFLFWEWWSINYLWTCAYMDSNYNSFNRADMERKLKVLNGELEHTEKRVIE